MSREAKAKAGYVGVRKRRRRVAKLSAAHGKPIAKAPEAWPSGMEDELAAAEQRAVQRPANPGVAVYPDRDNPEGWFLDSPHDDLNAWELMICEAFGTRSHATMWTFLHQLANLCQSFYHSDPKRSDGGGRWMPDEQELNFILATIHAERPETPLQAAVLAQMLANHLTQMRLSAMGLGSYVDERKAVLNAKLQNAFSNMTDAYLKLRGRVPKQEVTVRYERHVHVHHHKHAHIHQTPPGGGGAEIFEQPHDLIEAAPVSALPNVGVAPLPCSDPKRDTVPGARDAKSETLLCPRRPKPGGAEG